MLSYLLRSISAEDFASRSRVVSVSSSSRQGGSRPVSARIARTPESKSLARNSATETLTRMRVRGWLPASEPRGIEFRCITRNQQPGRESGGPFQETTVLSVAEQLAPIRSSPGCQVGIDPKKLLHGPWESNSELASVPESSACHGDAATMALDQTAHHGESDPEAHVRPVR